MLHKRTVVKFGTNLLTGGTDRLDTGIMSNLTDQVARLYQDGYQILIVTSGAVTAGRARLQLTKEDRNIPFKQVLASLGQSQLMQIYENLLDRHGIKVAQALLTRQDMMSRAGYLNARNTLLALIELGVVPIINENDVVATEELQMARFGDNDNLSAMVATLVDANLLILLTDIDGLYTADPRHNPKAKLIPVIEKIDSKILRLARGSSSKIGTGGMQTKIQAARLATSCGTAVVIANGFQQDILIKIAAGESAGTLFPPHIGRLQSRERWLISGLSSKGRITIDAGAVHAIREQNRSLLPAGIVEVEGKFQRGDVIDIYDNAGNKVGCGISNYGARDILSIKGAHSSGINGILGYGFGSEIIHRNNMVAE